MTCSRRGCTRRRFMDTDRCIDHQRGDSLFRAWFAFCALVALASLALGAWAVIALVTWVTR